MTEARLIAAGRLEPPTLELEFVGSRGVFTTFLILSGKITEPTALVYVESYGPFEVMSVDPWPDSGKFLVLRALG